MEISEELFNQIKVMCQELLDVEKTNREFWTLGFPVIQDATMDQLIRNDRILKNHTFTIARVLKQNITN